MDNGCCYINTFTQYFLEFAKRLKTYMWINIQNEIGKIEVNEIEVLSCGNDIRFRNRDRVLSELSQTED